MLWTTNKANEIYGLLEGISHTILKELGMVTQPTCNKNRTRSWSDGYYDGVLYHYTGGPNGEKSMRWCSDPGWGNKGSSWHVTIFDRVPNSKLGEMWYELSTDELKHLFPVPTIIMASWAKGTWHGNWINKWCLGIENRNIGAGWRRLGGKKKAETRLSKKLVFADGDHWEPYTRQQLIANINIGRLANHYIDGQLNPDLVLPHSAVWCSKRDPGPLFPLVAVRHSIFGLRDPWEMDWVSGYGPAPCNDEFGGPSWDLTEDKRDVSPTVWMKAVPVVDNESLTWARPYLYAFGFNAMTGDTVTLHEMVKWFQLSTRAYNKSKSRKKYVLKADGYVGPKTRAAMEFRAKELKIVL